MMRCTECNRQIEPMYPYYNIIVNNTDAPEHTIHRFERWECLVQFRKKNIDSFTGAEYAYEMQMHEEAKARA